MSANTALTDLNCRYNQLTALDVSANTALTSLYCNANQLTSLDVSYNTALEELRCDDNQLTYLNMSNGVTDQLTTFDATENSLDCIEVNAEDVEYAAANWTHGNSNIDEGVTFQDICSSYYSTYVPDDNFEQALIDLGYDDVLDDYVVTDSISGVTYLNVNNDSISDLTGIEAFIALATLKCQDNQLTNLNHLLNVIKTCSVNNILLDYNIPDMKKKYLHQV